MIRFENVSFGYGGDRSILRDLSFTISSGSFQFLTGPSGSGKTSLLRLLMMQSRPTSGNLHLFGENVGNLSRHSLPILRRRIGIVFQDFRLLDHLTVYENVALPLIVSGAMESSYRHDIIELLQWVGLSDCLHDYPPLLSGGEQQRAAIARSVINQPELLLADEPTGNLDPDLSRRLLRLFIELNRTGTCIVLATHETDLLEQYYARRLVLEEGRVSIHD